jgi:hypothetical protein
LESRLNCHGKVISNRGAASEKQLHFHQFIESEGKFEKGIFSAVNET